MAVRYSDRTILRSSSNQRASLLPDKSIAPPFCQNEFQCRCEANAASPKSGNVFASKFVGEKAQTSSSRWVFCEGTILNSCFAVFVSVAPVLQLAKKIGVFRINLMQNCFMRLRPAPIGSFCVAGTVGKADSNRQPPLPD